MPNHARSAVLAFLVALLASRLATAAELRLSRAAGGLRVAAGDIVIQCSRDLHFRVFLKKRGNWITLSPVDGTVQADVLQIET